MVALEGGPFLAGKRPGGRAFRNATLAPEWVEAWRYEMTPAAEGEATCVPLLCGGSGEWRPGEPMDKVPADRLDFWKIHK